MNLPRGCFSLKVFLLLLFMFRYLFGYWRRDGREDVPIRYTSGCPSKFWHDVPSPYNVGCSSKWCLCKFWLMKRDDLERSFQPLQYCNSWLPILLEPKEQETNFSSESNYVSKAVYLTIIYVS